MTRQGRVKRLAAVATVLPPLVSSTRLVPFLGVMVFASLVVTKIFFYETFISVWCFFAAVISALVVLVVRRVKSETAPPPCGAIA